MKIPDGPYLGAAYFCNGVKGVSVGDVSMPEIIRTLYAGTPDAKGSVTISPILFVLLHAGGAIGKHRLRVEVTAPPAGKRTTMDELPVEFTTPTSVFHVAAGIIVSCGFGELTCDLFYDDAFLTQVYLEVLAGHGPLRPMRGMN